MLRGEAALVAAPVRLAAARRHAIPPGLELVGAGGWTVGGVLLARYDETATLPYHELIVFSALARRSGRLAFVVSHIYVDSDASLAGGREIWGLPKELASFEWSPRAMTVDQGGRRLLSARLRRRGGGGVPIPLLAAVFGALGGVAVRA
ncbi:MAG: acetoacetate decarboxylase family protein, partial [Actinomycetota bacterium]|nr:acetoacetate decarboxylase family protein [Actinomycetota bacterium]